MSEKHITRRSLSDRKPGATDWDRVRKLDDDAIDKAIADDPDAAPALDADWFANAEVVMPEPKVPISIRLDREVLDWFKSQGPGYQSRMNAVLKAYISSRKAG
ncbi:MAG: BrnA antitoxin family protein [Bacteroidota bacterium]